MTSNPQDPRLIAEMTIQLHDQAVMIDELTVKLSEQARRIDKLTAALKELELAIAALRQKTPMEVLVAMPELERGLVDLALVGARIALSAST